MKINKITAREYFLEKPYTFGSRKKDISELPDGYVLLRPIIAGICGSEILYFKGQKEAWKLKERLPICLLHEGVAEIIETRNGGALRKGTYVVVNPLIPCGTCSACLNLEENLCQNSRYMASSADGLSRSFFVYPENRVIPIPSGIELEIASLTEPFSIVLNAIEKAQLGKEEKVGVIGDGAIGYILALAAFFVTGTSKENLYFVGVVDDKLSLAKDFASTINSIREKQKLKDIFGCLDVVFEAAGGSAHQTTVGEAINLLKAGGRCILIGISQNEVPIDVTSLVNKELVLEGSTRSRIDHYHKALQLLSNKELRDKIKRIISEESFTLNTVRDLESAFRFADTDEGDSKVKPGRVMVYFPSNIN